GDANHRARGDHHRPDELALANRDEAAAKRRSQAAAAEHFARAQGPELGAAHRSERRPRPDDRLLRQAARNRRRRRLSALPWRSRRPARDLGAWQRKRRPKPPISRRASGYARLRRSVKPVSASDSSTSEPGSGTAKRVICAVAPPPMQSVQLTNQPN